MKSYCKHCREEIFWDGFDWVHERTWLYGCYSDRPMLLSEEDDSVAVAESGGRRAKK